MTPRRCSASIPKSIGSATGSAGVLWHFSAMWVLVIQWLVYLTPRLPDRSLPAKLLPIASRQIFADAKAALSFKLSHADICTTTRVRSCSMPA